MGETTEEADTLMRQAFPLHQSGDINAAEALYRRILTLEPEYADAHYLLGLIERGRGQREIALEHFHRAISGKGDEAAFHRTLGQLLLEQRRWEPAATALLKALELDPSDPQTWIERGCALSELSQFGPAVQCFEHVLGTDPNHATALYNGGSALRGLGRTGEATKWLRRARDLAPTSPEVWSSYLFSLNFDPHLDRAEVWREHEAFDQAFGSGVHGVPRRAARDPDPDRKLRIAYFSPDLQYHAVSCFVEPLLVHHDRRQFEVWCYNLHPTHDAMSDRLEEMSDGWVECAALTDEQLFERLVADGIDLLVDLAGHTAWNRLPVLAAKPAPVIVTWLGYLNTTGLKAVDYRITDAVSDPPGTEAFHSEQLVRLPHAQWGFARPFSEARVAPLPALRHGRVCFGSMNKSSKLSPEVLENWATVLARLPGSTMLFVAVAEEQRGRIHEGFAAQGIAPERLRFADRVPREQFHALHDRIDIAFDAYPYSGATTTFDSLWMGVPTLTLAGDSPISRSTASILTTLGLDDWIARSKEDFVEMAIRKAADLPTLAFLRAGLRQRLETSILMEGERFTRHLEENYRAMWRAHCAGAGSSGATPDSRNERT